MLVLKKLNLNLLEIVTFLTLKVIIRDHPTRLKKPRLSSNRNFQIQPSNKQEYFCPNYLCPIKNLSQIIHQRFGHVYITKVKIISRKGLMKRLPTNLPDLEEPWPIYLLSKATKMTRVPTIDVSIFPTEFMIQMNFSFLNVESIHVFTSTFKDIRYATSHPFGFLPRIKLPPLDILKFIVTISRNKDNKVSFIQFYEYGAL